MGRVRKSVLVPHSADAMFELVDRVELYPEFLPYEFATPVLEAVVGPVFNHIANTFMDAFVHRAEAVYASGR